MTARALGLLFVRMGIVLALVVAVSAMVQP